MFKTENQTNIKLAKRLSKLHEGVGIGNVISIIDSSKSLSLTLKKIIKSMSFDNGTSCSSENILIIYEKDYLKISNLLNIKKSIVLNKKNSLKLINTHWLNNNKLNPQTIAKDADYILYKNQILQKRKIKKYLPFFYKI